MSILQLFRLLITAVAQAFRYRSSMGKLRSASAQHDAIKSVVDAYRLGDYETGLQAVEGLRDSKGNPAAYCFFRGSLLMQLGRFDEAEKWLRENVAREEASKKSAIAYSTLGELLVHRQRYEEAMKCFEASLRERPDRGSTHRHIAECCLRRGDRPSEALQWARLAVEEDRAAKAASQEVHDLNLGEALATLAWTVAAASHNDAEVDRLAAEAAPLVIGQTASSAAQVHYHLGRAYADLGDTPGSERHFDEAARVDPRGIWGRAARAEAPANTR